MNRENINILLVDDDLDDCLFFKDALDALPVQTSLTTLHNGDQLMDLLKTNEHPPSVIFLDLNMPRKNGLECLIEIKTNPEFEINSINKIPVILFSTSNDKEIINRMYQNDAHYYIQKPANFSKLKQVIHHALNLTLLSLPANSNVNIHQPPKEDFVLSH